MDTRIRIGLVSGDMYHHSVSYFAHVILREYDRTKFHITVYSSCANTDDKTAALSSLPDAWRVIAGFEASAAADLIAADGIHILVDLAGHTANNRLDVLAMRPAPVQMTHIGYPNTTGLTRVDYRITDDIVDPFDSEQKYTEHLVRLTGRPFLCYTPSPKAPAVSAAPIETTGVCTFGSFNTLAKITARVIRCWSRVLLAVPGSRLVLKSKAYADAAVRQSILSKFEHAGVDPARVTLLGLFPSLSDHLASYAMMDVSLDSFRYAGTTTTVESLYMGVPCVTLTEPHNHAHNVGRTLLEAVGLGDLVASTEDAYVAAAAKLARDPTRISETRRTLRARLVDGPLGDSKGYMDTLQRVYESAYALWRRHGVGAPQRAAPNATISK